MDPRTGADTRAPGSTPQPPAPQPRPVGSGGVSPVLVSAAPTLVTPATSSGSTTAAGAEDVVRPVPGSTRQRVTRALGAGVFAEGE
jgi:hypothetical protein